MNEVLKAKLETLPLSPGVYFHKSSSGEVIYVGKAAVLRSRVRQYFQASRGFDSKTLALVSEIADVDWLETESEVDALFLESEMVKRYMPRYNVLLRDDKSQSFVRIDMKSDWPTVSFTRNPLDDGAEYIGPFYNGLAVKKALRYLRRVFPYLTSPRRPGQSKLNEDLGLSPRLEDGPESYKANLRRLMQYIRGNRVALARELEREMKLAAREEQFEEAARLRNKLGAMRELTRRVMFGEQEFLSISKDKALRDIRRILGLKSEPARIEGFDVSHISGANVVASMVVFVNGVSARSEYRKFKLSRQQNDDFFSMYETVFRRFSQKNQKAWGLPDLVLIDGGKGQLQAAIRAMKERGVQLPVVAIAKKNEEIVVHKSDSAVDISAVVGAQWPGVVVIESGEFYLVNLHVGLSKSRGHASNLRGPTVNSLEFDDVVKLFQRIRDESHRFAISYHSVLRRTQQTKNILEDIAGIGPKTRARLMRHFGSVRGLRAAGLDEMAAVVGPAKARLILKHIGGNSSK